jgi:hypothetical protein
MTARPIPRRHWRSYGTEPLLTGAEALDEPFRSFLSWFMRITCDRCGKDSMPSPSEPCGSSRLDGEGRNCERPARDVPLYRLEYAASQEHGCHRRNGQPAARLDRHPRY